MWPAGTGRGSTERSRMNVRSALSAGLCLLVGAMVAVNVAGAVRDGAVDASFAHGQCSAVATAVGASAMKAGLRPNDVVEFQRLSRTDRLGFADPFGGRFEGAAGERVTLPVVRGDQHLTVRAPLEPAARTPLSESFDALGLVVYLLTGAFVLWRGRDVAAYALGAFLLCFAAGGFAFDLTGFLPPLPRVAFNVLAFGFTAGAIYAGFVLNERLSQGILDDRVLRVLGIVTAAYCIAYAAIVVGSQLTLPLFGCTLPLYGRYVLLFFAGAVGVMAVLGAAAIRSHFKDRRVAWLFWTTVLCLVPFIVLRSVDTIFGVNLMSHDWLRLAVESLPFVLLPISYAYAILRYHVVDVSFVLNRALVFAVLSTALLGGVILAEAFAEKAALGKNASLALELAVPLVLGLTFNAVHKRLETMVDRLLFSAKHRADVTLRRFAEDCGFIEKAATLRQRTVDLVCSQARCLAAALYDRTETGYRLGLGAGAHAFPGDVDADDEAFVRMRATAGPVDLDGLTSAIAESGVVFPLAAGGRIFGALVCGARPHEEPYDPDERELLSRVAQAVAAALAAARARERADFVAAVADERVTPEEARARARELRTED
jgi:hypothetical protein